jgi:hypothetical protein
MLQVQATGIKMNGWLDGRTDRQTDCSSESRCWILAKSGRMAVWYIPHRWWVKWEEAAICLHYCNLFLIHIPVSLSSLRTAYCSILNIAWSNKCGCEQISHHCYEPTLITLSYSHKIYYSYRHKLVFIVPAWSACVALKVLLQYTLFTYYSFRALCMRHTTEKNRNVRIHALLRRVVSSWHFSNLYWDANEMLMAGKFFLSH